MLDFRRMALGLFLTGTLAAGCNGSIGGHEPTNTGPTRPGDGPTNVNPGSVTVTATPLTQAVAYSAVRKTKNLLTGMAPSDDDVALVTQKGAAGLQQLITTWMTTDPYQGLVETKMIGFFRNMFQQTGFVPTEDFKMQLLTNGGFDFGGNTRSVGGDAFPRLVQNLQDSFAFTAWQLVKEGHPFTETLTTNRFYMTTGLKSLYVEVDMPADAPNFRATTPSPAWTIDYSGTPIPIETALSTMTFSDEPVAGATTGTGTATTCRGGATVANGMLYGTSLLFQRLLGHVPQFPSSGTQTCAAEAANPYFTTQDLTDWGWVTINAKAAATDRTAVIQPYDLPSLRKATSLTLSLPRIGFFTTPAFLALWNTNDSNQHRVTANQALLVALGQAFTAENTIIPFSNAGLDSGHAVAGSECVGCHATLDPMRGFWGNQFDYNDRNDFPAAARGAPTNNRPTTIVDEFAFGDFRATGSSIGDFGTYLTQVSDGNGLPRFGIATVQQLCFFANSGPCSESDPELRRVVASFRDSNFNYAALMKEFFASPLVTGAVATGSFDVNAVPVSVSRRDHLCAALANRLGKPDICAQAVLVPSTTQTATARIASSIAADAFSRGAQSPVTPSDPTLFYSSATEMLCENVAVQVVDATAGTVWASTDVAGSIQGMVETIMGYPPSHPLHAQAIQILTDHNAAVVAASTSRNAATKATTGLRSAFVLACESPTALGIGL